MKRGVVQISHFKVFGDTPALKCSACSFLAPCSIPQTRVLLMLMWGYKKQLQPKEAPQRRLFMPAELPGVAAAWLQGLCWYSTTEKGVNLP